MWDAFGIGAGTKKVQRQAADEMQGLINTAKEERSALAEMLTQVSVRSAKLTQTGKQLEEVDKNASATSGRIDELNHRLNSLDERSKSMEDVDKRIKVLMETVKQA